MTAILAVEQLSLRFGPVTALDDVTFAVSARERVALVGPNGAGKTSVLNCVSGVERPTGGRIRFGGRDVTRMRPASRARLGIARTLQALAVVDDLDVRSNLLLGIRAHRPRCETVAAELGLEPVLGARAGGLPTGARKRLELGRALASDADLLLLDEPFAGAEASDVALMVEAIRRSGRAAIIVDHDIDTVVGLADRVVWLDGGRVAVAPTTPPAR